MVTTIQRWGNSLAVRIPKPFAVQASLAEDTDVEITVEKDRIIISPLKRQWKLEGLLKSVAPANQHTELQWGEPKGKETW